MIVWDIRTRKVKGFRKDAHWRVAENFKSPIDAIQHFLGSHNWYKEKHITKVERIKL